MRNYISFENFRNYFRNISPLASGAALGVSVLLAFFYKVTIMGSEATGPILLATFQHDSILFGIGIFMFTVSYLIDGYNLSIYKKNKFATLLSFTVRILIIIGVAIYFFDIIIYKYFVTRLYIEDVYNFRNEIEGGLSLFLTGEKILLRITTWKLFLIVLIVFFFNAVVVNFILARGYLKKSKTLWLLISSCLFVILSYVEFPGYVYSFENKPFYENIIERNYDYINPNRYSNEFRANILNNYKDNTILNKGLSVRPNIILLIVESLSSYHSYYFSHINNFTPNLDRLARENYAFINYFANGWTTQGGLISLLTGTFPIVGENAHFNHWGSVRFHDFRIKDTLPNFLNEFGYRSYFYCSGDLSFMGQDQWLKDIGFNEIEGHESNIYAGEPRGPFKSVRDDVLYKRVLKQIINNSLNVPFFITIETLWSHRPFLSSDGSKDTEENVFRYSDRQIGYLYSELYRNDFFKNGILIITGDHRAMESFSKLEWETYGSSAPARIPMVIIWKDGKQHKVNLGNFQQVDLLTSIKYVVSNEYRQSSYLGNFLSSNPIQAPCVFQARGDNRDIIYLLCGRDEAFVKIDGDNTRFIKGHVKDESFVINKINYDRILK